MAPQRSNNNPNSFEIINTTLLVASLLFSIGLIIYQARHYCRLADIQDSSKRRSRDGYGDGDGVNNGVSDDDDIPVENPSPSPKTPQTNAQIQSSNSTSSSKSRAGTPTIITPNTSSSDAIHRLFQTPTLMTSAKSPVNPLLLPTPKSNQNQCFNVNVNLNMDADLDVEMEMEVEKKRLRKPNLKILTNNLLINTSSESEKAHTKNVLNTSVNRGTSFLADYLTSHGYNKSVPMQSMNMNQSYIVAVILDMSCVYGMQLNIRSFCDGDGDGDGDIEREGKKGKKHRMLPCLYLPPSADNSNANVNVSGGSGGSGGKSGYFLKPLPSNTTDTLNGEVNDNEDAEDDRAYREISFYELINSSSSSSSSAPLIDHEYDYGELRRHTTEYYGTLLMNGVYYLILGNVIPLLSAATSNSSQMLINSNNHSDTDTDDNNNAVLNQHTQSSHLVHHINVIDIKIGTTTSSPSASLAKINKAKTKDERWSNSNDGHREGGVGFRIVGMEVNGQRFGKGSGLESRFKSNEECLGFFLDPRTTAHSRSHSHSDSYSSELANLNANANGYDKSIKAIKAIIKTLNAIIKTYQNGSCNIDFKSSSLLIYYHSSSSEVNSNANANVGVKMIDFAHCRLRSRLSTHDIDNDENDDDDISNTNTNINAERDNGVLQKEREVGVDENYLNGIMNLVSVLEKVERGVE